MPILTTQRKQGENKKTELRYETTQREVSASSSDIGNLYTLAKKKKASMSIQRTSSYSPPLSCWKYDVFLSFRGGDTRKNFIDHLNAAFHRRGINAFKDDKELEKGKSISLELFKAMEESRISIIIFSINYASSTWCLDELVHIVHCRKKMKQMVVPIFYDVDPSVVRKQTGSFREAFAKHEEAFRKNIEKVQKWRIALTEVANLCGWDLKDRHESEFVQDIVREMSRKLCPTTLRSLEGLVGINSRLENLRRALMAKSSNDVCMIGIYGMGGIGKTTIARAIHDLISSEFEGSNFLSNVREISRKNNLVHLQKQLLSQILGEINIHIWDVYEGIRMIKRTLCHKKVLIVVDDVDDIKQLNELIGEHKWFGLGSRIIITTRDKHLLMAHGVDRVYKVEELDDDEALQLFSMKAFKTCSPPKEYVKMSNYVVKYACGLPLALEVLGSFLFGRTEDEWESALQRLGRDYEKGILESLQISFDGLKETEKKIFLDITCFFNGKNKDHVTRILDGCGFNPTISISILVDKSLITISNKKILRMHDVIQEMGQQIVKREFQEPGKRSRLWEETDVHDVLTKNLGTEAVEGIILEKEVQSFSIRAEAFSKMTNLRLFKISNVQLPQGLEYLSNNLRLLEWHGYPLKSLPSSVKLNKTVELKMHYSRIEQLWKETKPLYRLKVVSLIHSKKLKLTPDFTNIPNLEELILEGCTNLCEIHPSLMVHKKLISLNLRDCTSLTTLSRKMEMQSLKILILSGCVKLKTFPEIVQSLACLSELCLDKTPIKELPFPVQLMKEIVSLSLKDCRNLLSLPSNINVLGSLQTLELSGCSELEEVPETLGQTESLEKLDVSQTALRQPVSIFGKKNLKELSFCGCRIQPSNSWYMQFPLNWILGRSSNPITLIVPSSSDLRSLTKLNLSDCNLGEGAICTEISSLVSLKELNLEKNNFVSLPASINRLSKLKYLYLDNCKRLESVPELPLNLSVVTVDNCTLERFPNSLKSRHTWICIQCMNCLKLLDCNATFSSPKELIPNPRAEAANIITPGSKVPKWFSHQSEGSSIRIKCQADIKLKGFFVCFVFSAHKNMPAFSNLCHFRCYSEMECSCSIMLRSYGNHVLLDHLWLIYIPIWRIHNGSSKNPCQFEFDSSRCPGVIVRRCAAHPIYEQDVGEFELPTDQCRTSSSGNSIEFHQDFVATSEMDDPTIKRSLTECGGVGTSETGEEPQPKRHKKF